MSELSTSQLNALIERLNDNPTRSDIAQAGKTLLKNVSSGNIGVAKTGCGLTIETKALSLVNNAITEQQGSVMLKPEAQWFNTNPSTACEIVRTR